MILKRVEHKNYIKLRILATLIDYSIFGLFFCVYVYTVGHQNDYGTYVVSGFAVLPIFAVWFIYFVVLEAVNQATPGHDIFKLVVVRSDSEKISLYSAFNRRALDIIDVGLYGIPALICISKTQKFQRLGDIFADTLVVKKSDIIETEITFNK